MKHLLFTFLFVTLCIVSHSQSKWVYISTSKQGHVFSIKPDKLNKSGSYIKAWIKIQTPVDRVWRKDKFVTYKNTTRIELMEFDCNENKCRVRASTVYFEDGKLETAFDEEDTINLAFEYPLPESVGEASLQKACEIFTK